VGKRQEIAGAGFSAKGASHTFNEDFDPIPGSNESSNQGFQTFEWAFSNPDALSGLESLRDLDNSIRTRCGFGFLLLTRSRLVGWLRFQKGSKAW
jgi:hypothetical protein